MSQFDVAAALYKESAWALYYLDHDPKAAAQALPYALLGAAPGCAAKLLTAVWHRHNPATLPLDAEATYARLFGSRAPKAMFRQATLQEDSPDPFYKEFSGDKPYALLLGQKVLPPEFATHPNVTWVQSCKAAYQWAHAYGMHAAHEWHLRTRRKHPTLPQLWTLEHLPPDLLNDDDPLYTPDPQVPGNCILLDSDGNYDTVSSYRLDLITNKRALWNWPTGCTPQWLLRYDKEGSLT